MMYAINRDYMYIRHMIIGKVNVQLTDTIRDIG